MYKIITVTFNLYKNLQNGPIQHCLGNKHKCKTELCGLQNSIVNPTLYASLHICQVRKFICLGSKIECTAHKKREKERVCEFNCIRLSLCQLRKSICLRRKRVRPPTKIKERRGKVQVLLGKRQDHHVLLRKEV